MKAQEGGRSDVHQGVVHLVVEDRVGAPAGHVVEGARVEQGGERPPVAIGALEDPIRCRQHQLPREVEARHHGLAQEGNVAGRQPEVAGFLEARGLTLLIMGACPITYQGIGWPQRARRRRICCACCSKRVRPVTGPSGKPPFGPGIPSRVAWPPATTITATRPSARSASPRARASAQRCASPPDSGAASTAIGSSFGGCR